MDSLLGPKQQVKDPRPNRVIEVDRKVFFCLRKGSSRRQDQFHLEEVCNVYASHNNIGEIKSRRKRLAI
jgi:hypothetical protein